MREQDAQEQRGKLVMLGAPGMPHLHLETEGIIPAILAGEWYVNLGDLARVLMEPFFRENPECGSLSVAAFAEEVCTLFVERLYGDTTPEIATAVSDLAWRRSPCGNYCAVMETIELGANEAYLADYSAFVATLKDRWGVSVDEDDTDRVWRRLRHVFNLLWLAVYLAPRQGERDGHGPLQTQRTAR